MIADIVLHLFMTYGHCENTTSTFHAKTLVKKMKTEWKKMEEDGTPDLSP